MIDPPCGIENNPMYYGKAVGYIQTGIGASHNSAATTQPTNLPKCVKIDVIPAISPVEKTVWSPEEDQILVDRVKIMGKKKWKMIAEDIPSHSAKQCRERWFHRLDPTRIKTQWSQRDDSRLLQAHTHLGNQWTKIMTLFTGRTDNDVKNRYHCLMAKMKTRAKDLEMKTRPVSSLVNEQVQSPTYPSFSIPVSSNQLKVMNPYIFPYAPMSLAPMHTTNYMNNQGQFVRNNPFDCYFQQIKKERRIEPNIETVNGEGYQVRI